MRRSPFRFLTAAALMAALLATSPVHAQGFSGPGGGGGGHHGGGRRHGGAAPAANADSPKPIPEPVQRLDPGALLCRTEDALQQHQAAVAARLDGRDAAEPAGCHLVAGITPVSILERHGPARTEVHLPGPPEQTGWTDARVRDAPAPSPPRAR